MCLLCKQVCVFSAIACECSAKDVSCIRHYHMLCRCGKYNPGDHLKREKSNKGPVNRRFLISWASIKDLQRLRSESKKFLLGDMASPPPTIKPEQDVVKNVQIKEEVMNVVKDIYAADSEAVDDSDLKMVQKVPETIMR